MTGSNQEERLRAMFAAERREDAEAAPSFPRTMAAVRRRLGSERRGSSHRWRIAAVAVPVAAALTLALWAPWSTTVSSPDGGFDVAQSVEEYSTADWGAVTDELLDTPGADLLESLPALGEGADYGIEFPQDVNPDAAATGNTTTHV